MAHFAEIDSSDVVLRVVVVNNEVLLDGSGVEQESLGVSFLEGLYGGTWKQTSYNENFRGLFAGVGYTYDSQLDQFVAPVESE